VREGGRERERESARARERERDEREREREREMYMYFARNNDQHHVSSQKPHRAVPGEDDADA
jgi:hypothetical protein